MPSPSFQERSDRLLRELEARTEFAGQQVTVAGPEWVAIASALNWKELEEILSYLTSTKRVLSTPRSIAGADTVYAVKITLDGWQHLESLRESNPRSKVGFVAMKFSDRMWDVYDSAIAPALVAAGYEPQTVKRFQPRAGQPEYTEDLVAKIQMMIRRSRFVVADFSEHSAGVYFEAGFAKGLGRIVIWTAHEPPDQPLHFDTNHFEHLMWKDSDDLRIRLQERIEAILGRG